MNRTRLKIRAAHDTVLIAIFLGGISLPLAFVDRQGILAATALNRIDRPVSGMGKIRWTIKQFGVNFNEHFGFRQNLIHAYAEAAVQGMGVSSSRAVILGKEGWLFYAGDEAAAGKQPPAAPTGIQVDRWNRLLADRQSWLAARGITYLFVIAPNKETIYPEYIPESTLLPYRPSWTDQFIAYVQQHSRVPILDLRAPIFLAKASESVYFKTDTHWNTLGAIAAYETIANALRERYPQLEPISMKDFDIVKKTRESGDLGRLLGLQSDLHETIWTAVPRVPSPAHVIEGGVSTAPGMDISYSENSRVVYECPTGEISRMLFFHDSFGELLGPLLARHARRSIHRWSDPLDRVLVEREHPDVVVQEIIERKLAAKPPDQ